MIAVDTSSLVSYFKKDEGSDIILIEKALFSGALVLPPVVLSEIFSAQNLPKELADNLLLLKLLEIKDGYWQRCGLMRSKLIAKKLKARLADTMVAQICIDNDVPLITRDSDFRHFTKYFGLKLM